MHDGLSREEAGIRLKQDGFNELAPKGKRNLWAIARDVLFEPMFLLLVLSGIIYLVLGDMGEAAALLFFVFVVMGITVYQENKTERALEALHDLTSPRANVIREGQACRIAGREVVTGDILLLSEGDRIAADAVLLECNDFSADESLLTGESAPVLKMPQDRVYSGTMVTQGKGMASVFATGMKSEIGGIGLAIESVESEKTPLQKEIARLVKNLSILAACLFVLLVVSYAMMHGEWLNGLLAGITMAMAILPEEFPVVLTVFLALGAWRIARSNVLTRRLHAVETLGSASVLCVDKTGTLTENRMSVAQLCAGGEPLEINSVDVLPEDFHELLEYSILASEIDPFDPMEKAFHDLGRRFLAQTEHLHFDWELVHEYSLSPEMLAMSHVWKASKGGEYIVAAKGSPEAIFNLCHLDEHEFAFWSNEVARMADGGLRVLGVAHARYRGESWPAIQHDFEFELAGLAGLMDPVRAGVVSAVRECREAGIRVVMITGDNPLTARAIARRIGLDLETISGPEIEAMDEDEFVSRIGNIDIFARVVPLQKLRIVNALRRSGKIVAMTGDGVNDAPALKAAHIGVAMGRRGTDVAREAAALVLLDDDFSSIVHAVRLGRRIYSNLKKAFSFSLAVHVPIAGLSLIPVFMGWPLVFYPVHIAFLQLIIDPVCSLVFEAEAADTALMKEPPRKTGAPLLDGKTMALSLLQGSVVLAAILAMYAANLDRGETHARAIAFSTLVFSDLALILVSRSRTESVISCLKKPNPLLWWVLGGSVAALLLVLNLPFFHGLFGFSTLSLRDVALSFILGTLSVAWFEVFKGAH
ncbi:MAG: cation-translocating P-type ATPase [Burkholderiales bacterium]|nr:cation-translocating P-type ATPase [Burkholderiales bacterium]